MPKLIFLGTSGSVLTKERMYAGILFNDKLLDVGFGVLTNLIRSGKRLDSINDLYISHTHSDHIGDFTGLVWAMAMEGRTKPLRIVSSSSAGAALDRILDLQSTPYAWVKFDISFVRPDDVSVKSVTTVHDPENLGYRFQTTEAISSTSETQPSPRKFLNSQKDATCSFTTPPTSMDKNRLQL